MATAQSEPDPVAALAARRTIASIPRGRKLEETGAFAAYLASDQAAWITGQFDAIDGGYAPTPMEGPGAAVVIPKEGGCLCAELGNNLAAVLSRFR